MNFSLTVRERTVLRALLAERAEALLAMEREGLRQMQVATSDSLQMSITNVRQEWACVTRILDKVPRT
jgi:hypothetical protein